MMIAYNRSDDEPPTDWIPVCSLHEAPLAFGRDLASREASAY